MAESSSTARQLVGGAPPGHGTGDRLQTLIGEHHDFVWRSLRRLGLPSGDVDDACQQVFLVAYRRLGAIAPPSERSFLFQTAVRVAADWRRAHRRRGEQVVVELGELPDGAANPEEMLDEGRARALLDRVLGAMPMELRAVFVLYELEEMTMIEIATLTELPSGTVASRLRRARAAFRDGVVALTRARREPKGEP